MLSVIIPTYNRSSFLQEAIQSVLDQEFFGAHPDFSYKIILVDDGSTDNTKQIVSFFGKRVNYHYQRHKGVSAARNLGLGLAQGDYIAFLDSDDLWKKEKIGVQLSFMRAFPQAKVCYTDEIWIRRGVYVNPKKRHQKYSGCIFDKVLPLCLISLSSALFRREVFGEIGKFDESLPACEDYDFGIRLAYKYPVYFLSQPLIVKRGGHPDQLSRKYWGMDRFRIQALDKALLLDLSADQEGIVKEEIVKKCRILVNGFEKRKKESEAKKYLFLIEKYKTQVGERKEKK